MDLTLNYEQQQIIDSTAAFLQDKLPVERLHGDTSAPWRVGDDLWRQMAELGWFALGLDEELGGIGYTLVEEALLVQQAGRQLAPLSLIASMLGARLAALAGQADVAAEIMAGNARVGILRALSPTGKPGDGISGHFHCYDIAQAKYLLLATTRQATLINVESLSEQQRELTACIDASTSLAVAELESCVAVSNLIGTPAGGLFRRGQVLTAFFQIGQAERCLDMAVEYAKTREQFGKPIGAFQAIKHLCADMSIRASTAYSLGVYTAISQTGSNSSAAVNPAVLRYLAARAARLNAADTVQIHGGIGFTDEHDAHLYVKRAHVLDLLFGSPGELRVELLAA